MGKFHIGIKDQPYADNVLVVEANTPIKVDNSIATFVPEIKIEERIVYIDRPIEIIKEVPVETIVEKIIEVPGKTLIEYKTVEVPVMYEKEVIKEVPVYIEKEVNSKVIDITEHLDLKKMKRKNKNLKMGLILSIILNVLIMVVR